MSVLPGAARKDQVLAQGLSLSTLMEPTEVSRAGGPPVG